MRNSLLEPGRLRRAWGVALLLAALIGASPAHPQDLNLKLGAGATEEQIKARKELADKLPPEQAAAWLKHQNAWDNTAAVLQWTVTAAIPISIVALVLSFRYRRQRVAHETVRTLVEQGLPVPPELINPPPPPPKNDLRRGLVWLGLGGGLCVALAKLFEDAGLWTLGLIPAFIGLAFLVCWGVAWNRERRERQPGNLRPGIFWLTLGLALFAAMKALAEAPGDWSDIERWRGLAYLPIGLGLAHLVYGFLEVWLAKRPSKHG